MTAQALIKILQPAIITQLQDLGRFGYMHQGISVSGCMDETAFLLNNRLLGNDDNAAQLEIAPGGLHLQFLADTVCALAGAYANPTLDGKPLINYHSFTGKAGQELRMTYPKTGQYSYLAIAGGFLAEPILGSRAVCARLSLDPAPIRRGTELFGNSTLQNRPARQGVKRSELPDMSIREIEVLPAYQYDEFSEQAKTAFTGQSWKVSKSDRMGTLLQAPQAIEWIAGELLSEGIMPGAVQISNNGMPIVLQKDAQSIGGYPKIGVLTHAARSRLAQIKTGEKIRFVFV